MQPSEFNPPAPVVGVLVGHRTIFSLHNQKTNSQISHLTKANEEAQVTLYFFDISSVDFKTLSIKGMYWAPQKKIWQQKKFSFPDVLYIKGGGAPKAINKLVSLIRLKGGVLNYPRFDKWKVYHCLLQNAKIKEYLPETKVYTVQKDLLSMLNKYGIVYLKPLRGRKGRRVLRIEELMGTGYRLSDFDDTKGPLSGLKKREVNEFSSVIRELNNVYGNTPFLIQRAINLVTLGDKLVDLRAEMQRNKDGEIEILGVSARVGGSQSPITTHASAVTLDNYLTQICKFPKDSIPGIQEDIGKFLFSVYAGIEDCYGKYGEIGIDFGIDKRGKIWYIECNSQSTKVSLGKAYGWDSVYKSFLGVLNYAKHLYSKQQEPPVSAEPPVSPELPVPPDPVPSDLPVPPKPPAPGSPVIIDKAKDIWKDTSDGPQVIVGVFVRQHIITKLINQEHVFRLQRLAKANETAKTILYAFSIEDVNFNTITIDGSFFNVQAGKWEKRTFPFPDVIYNRKGNSRSTSTDRLRQVIKELAIKMVNPVNDFDKWDLYKRLSGIGAVREHLPFTFLFKSVKELRLLLSRYGSIYLKAAVGRNGTTIMRLKQTKEGYACSYVDNQLRTMQTQNWNEVVTLVESFYGNKKFLVQQAIPVFSINGRNVDLRAELQRNGRGELEVTYICVRMGVKNSPVTSTRTDSTVLGLSDFLRDKMQLSEADYNATIVKVKEFLITVYESVESIYGNFGELGIDFALDADLKLWLIECNAKSAKMALISSADEKSIDRVFLNPLEYAKFIADNH